MVGTHISSRTEAIVSLRPKFAWDVFCDHISINVDQLGAICLLSLEVLKISALHGSKSPELYIYLSFNSYFKSMVIVDLNF